MYLDRTSEIAERLMRDSEIVQELRLKRQVLGLARRVQRPLPVADRRRHVTTTSRDQGNVLYARATL